MSEVDYKKRTSWEMRANWRKMKLPTMAEKNAEKGFRKTMAHATYDGDVLVKALRSILMADYDLVEELECLEYEG